MQAIQEANGEWYFLEGVGVFPPNAIINDVSDVLYNSPLVQNALLAGDIIDADKVEAPPPSPIPRQFRTDFPVVIRDNATATELKLQFTESLGGLEDSNGYLHSVGSTFITFQIELVDDNGNYLFWESLRGEDPGDGSVVLVLTNDWHFRTDKSYPCELGSGGGQFDLTTVQADNFIIHEEILGRGNVSETVEQQVFEKSITSAANVGDVTIATVMVKDCIIESVIVRANTASQTDLTYIEVKGAAAEVIMFIDSDNGVKENIDATGEQVAWVGAVELEVAETIIMTLVGTGVTPVDLTVIITYYPLATGGYLI